MSTVLQLLIATSVARLAMAGGGALASFERIRPNWIRQELRHSVIAFGGGILLAAVALVLVPQGLQRLPALEAGLAFVAGGLAFMGLARWLDARGGRSAQLVAMLADFLPESVALGAAFASGGSEGIALAVLIALQNIPEGFNAYREVMDQGKWRGRTVIAFMVLLAPLGPAMGLTGYYWLAAHGQWVAYLMLFSAGGILYLTFEDIAPQAKLRNARGPALGAVVGFAIGMLSEMLVRA